MVLQLFHTNHRLSDWCHADDKAVKCLRKGFHATYGALELSGETFI